MDLDIPDNLKRSIRKFTLHNALLHHGKANTKAVLGKILGDHAELRPKVKELMVMLDEIVDEINSVTIKEITAELEELAPELLVRKKQEKSLALPELPLVGPKVVMRFAPGPSGPLHIGHSRAIVLNDEYVKRYSGKFILRFEDTNPQNIEAEAYDMILEDLDWLGVKYHEVFKQSERFDLYYKWAEKLLVDNNAYICTCPVEHWRELKNNMTPCPDRALPSTDHLARWEQMLSRGYEPGSASLIVKTDLSHPNPAVRDFVAFRMVQTPHPITADKYYVYPTYNFSVAVDDHLMGMTHVLRGKDHLNNTLRQKYIYNYCAWSMPEFLHYGWVSLKDVILKTTTIKNGIVSGEFMDWSDVRLGTLRSLARRGIRPEAFRRYWLEVGINDVDIEFSWETLYAMNKTIIDKTTNRYFFVWDPKLLLITGASELISSAPLHPDDDSRGFRQTKLTAEPMADSKETVIKVHIPSSDSELLRIGSIVRLKDLGNIKIANLAAPMGLVGRYIGNDLSVLKEGAKIVHWVSDVEKLPTNVFKPDGEVLNGYCEKDTLNALGSTVQFERFGFVTLSDSTDPIVGWFAHK